jgi:hypothetical protein
MRKKEPNMQNMKTGVALLAVAMLALGCGGGDVPVVEQSTLETRADATRGYMYELVYYTGPDFDNEYAVGATYYPCEGKVTTWGQVTPYSRVEFYEYC